MAPPDPRKPPDAETENRRVAWGVVAASSAGFGLGLSGLPFYTAGVFVEPLHRAFGWSGAQIQAGLTLMLLSNMATLPAAAWLAGRFGSRRIALASVGAFGVSFMALGALKGSLWAFYLNFVMMSAAGAGTLGVIWARAISTWFSARRGAALGVAMMGTGATGLFAPIVAQALIGTIGWRGAYLALGVLPLLISLPLIWLLFRERAGVPDADGHDWRELLAPSAIGHWRFWAIGVGFLLIGCTVAGVIPNLIGFMTSRGFTAMQSAALASFVGLFVVFGRLSCGVLLDRMWAPAAAAIFFGAAAVGCLVLAAGATPPIVTAAAAAALGLAAGAEFDVMPYLAARYFGVERLGAVLALLSAFFYLGAALGPWGFRYLHDLTGGYGATLLTGACFLAVGTCALLSLGRYPIEAEDRS